MQRIKRDKGLNEAGGMTKRRKKSVVSLMSLL